MHWPESCCLVNSTGKNVVLSKISTFVGTSVYDPEGKKSLDPALFQKGSPETQATTKLRLSYQMFQRLFKCDCC